MDNGQWKTLKEEMEEAAYGPTGVVTQMRDGYSGPDEEANRELLALCEKAKKLILGQGHATTDQFSVFVDLVYEVMKFGDVCPWVADFGDELTDALMTE